MKTIIFKVKVNLNLKAKPLVSRIFKLSYFKMVKFLINNFNRTKLTDLRICTNKLTSTTGKLKN